MKSEIWNLKYELWNVKSGIWNMESEIWNMTFEIWNLKGDRTRNMKPGKENREYETRNIQLAGSTQVANKHLVRVTLGYFFVMYMYGSFRSSCIWQFSGRLLHIFFAFSSTIYISSALDHGINRSINRFTRLIKSISAIATWPCSYVVN